MSKYQKKANKPLALYRGDFDSGKKKKFDFVKKKDCVCKSLHEVEYFLNHLKDISKCLKLYRLLK